MRLAGPDWKRQFDRVFIELHLLTRPECSCSDLAWGRGWWRRVWVCEWVRRREWTRPWSTVRGFGLLLTPPAAQIVVPDAKNAYAKAYPKEDQAELVPTGRLHRVL